MTRTIRASVAIALTALFLGPATSPLQAGDRNKARTSVNSNKNVNRNTNVNSNKNVNVNSNRNVNRNTNVDIDRRRDVDIDIDVDHRHSGCCYHDNNGWGVAAAVATTAVVTAAVIGSTVNTLPPACTVVMVNGMTYQQCGSVWYQPQFVGTTTSYVVINAPR
jgi:hypothetical protein